jgi:hypothetical protein
MKLTSDKSESDWIKIAEDGSNLPKKDCYCWFLVMNEIIMGRFYILQGDFYSAVSGFQYHPREVTYYKLRTFPEPPTENKL